MEGIVIRKASFADSEPIATLVSELSYPTSTSQMQRRLKAILDDDQYLTLVACEEEHIRGFVGTRIGPLYEDDGYYGQIMALAVAQNCQRRGMGRLLMQSAESELIKRGARVLIVASGNQRSDAHAFYESCGYSFTGRRYKKTLAMST